MPWFKLSLCLFIKDFLRIKEFFAISELPPGSQAVHDCCQAPVQVQCMVLMIVFAALRVSNLLLLRLVSVIRPRPPLALVRAGAGHWALHTS